MKTIEHLCSGLEGAGTPLHDFFSIIYVYIVMVFSHVQVAPVREAYRHIHSTSNVELGNLEDYYTCWMVDCLVSTVIGY